MWSLERARGLPYTGAGTRRKKRHLGGRRCKCQRYSSVGDTLESRHIKHLTKLVLEIWKSAPEFQKFGFDEDAREKARLQTLVAGAVWRPGYGGEGADMPRDLGALTPASFRDYVRFNSIETVLMHFRKLDADGSGEMTVKEFREGVTKLGFTATKQDAALVFKWLDHDGSGVVPFIELDKKEVPILEPSLQVGAPLGCSPWGALCKWVLLWGGSRFVKLLSATKACKGFFTSGHVGGDGFAVTYSTIDLQERYNSVAATITMLQQGADELRQREEVLRLTGKTVPLYMDRMATWSFQSGSSCGHG